MPVYAKGFTAGDPTTIAQTPSQVYAPEQKYTDTRVLCTHFGHQQQTSLHLSPSKGCRYPPTARAARKPPGDHRPPLRCS